MVIVKAQGEVQNQEPLIVYMGMPTCPEQIPASVLGSPCFLLYFRTAFGLAGTPHQPWEIGSAWLRAMAGAPCTGLLCFASLLTRSKEVRV